MVCEDNSRIEKVASARDRKKYKRQRRKDVRRTRRRINDGEDAELTLFVCVICSVEVIELLAVFRSGIREINKIIKELKFESS